MARNVRAPPRCTLVTVTLQSCPQRCRFPAFLVPQPTLDRMITTRAVAEATEPTRAPPTAAAPEARLVFKSVARHYRLDDRLTAIVDIGGGSAEVILAAGGVIEQLHSLPLGAVRLTERYVRSDPLKNRDWKELRRAIDQEIDHAIGAPPFAAEVMIAAAARSRISPRWRRRSATDALRRYAITRSAGRS